MRIFHSTIEWWRRYKNYLRSANQKIEKEINKLVEAGNRNEKKFIECGEAVSALRKEFDENLPPRTS